MSDRRRNLFILLAVLGLIAASMAVVATKPTRLGLDLQGGVQLVYEGKPTKQQPTVTPEGLDRALDIMRDRVDALGVAEPELQRSGDEPDRRQPAGRRERRARRAPGRHHGADVLLRLGTEHPRRGLQDQPRVGQRRPAADQRALQRGQARVEVPAAGRPQQHDRRRPLLRASTRSPTQPLNDGVPEENRAATCARTSPTTARPRRREILEVPEGILVVRDEDRREPDQQKRRGRQLVGHQGQPGARRHRHQEPGAELRERHRRPADRHDGVHGQGPQGVRRDDARRSPSAAPTTPPSTAACRTRSARPTTSRSGSTTS